MTKSISILGSTGSIGTQTLDVARNLNINVLGLSANSNLDLLEKQAKEFKPQIVSVRDELLADEMAERLKGLGIEVFYGQEGLKKVASINEIDTVVTSIVGIAGLIPTMEAIKAGKNIALANKETLVTAGSIVMDAARKKGIEILPVDSEHSAIFQCLTGNRREDVSKLLLTASGGPFRGKTADMLENVTVSEALNHPNWSMGNKITIDSATMMNKGLEVIEAKWLFGIDLKNIEVLIHPQSVIHSMVEFKDGSIIAQLGSPDMRIPIQFALTYPERMDNKFSRLNFLEKNKLTFEAPDCSAFPCLTLAFEALETGGTMPVVLNAVNEVAVSLFLGGSIKFMDIPRLVENIMGRHSVNNMPCLNDIIEVDGWAREEAQRNLGGNICKF